VREVALKDGLLVAARFSLDGSILAIQRTSTDIEFLNLRRGCGFWQRCRPGERLLGFFWVNTPDCNMVLVTGAGLELFKLTKDMNGLTAVEVKKHEVAWYVYTHGKRPPPPPAPSHSTPRTCLAELICVCAGRRPRAETRLVLLASESSMPVKFVGYQFATSGIIRLPKFELVSQTHGGQRYATPSRRSVAHHPGSERGAAWRVFGCERLTSATRGGAGRHRATRRGGTCWVGLTHAWLGLTKT
jgi:hypothetical protein